MVEGDGSLTFDAFQIIQRDSDDVLIVNPVSNSAPVPAPLSQSGLQPGGLGRLRRSVRIFRLAHLQTMV